MEENVVTTSGCRPGTINRLLALLLLTSVVFVSACAATTPSIDPLPSWTKGETKEAIERFVVQVTTEGGPNFVPREQRIAVFDNDGTLWSERPWVEGQFKRYQIVKAAERDPSRRDRQPFKAAFENDLEYFEKGGWPVILGPARTVTSEVSREQYDAEVEDFFVTATHPDLNVPYQQTVYQPVIELITHLRANDFEVYICSGGGIDFMRVISSELYGIEPDQVIGTSLTKELQKIDGRWTLVTKDKVDVFNNKDRKAISIDLHIGQHPLLVMGNEGGRGDIGMLGYSQGRDGLSLQILINHDDEVREYQYAEDDDASLKAAKENGWLVVSMKNDWTSIYPAREE
jgi:hypothetical protein